MVGSAGHKLWEDSLVPLCSCSPVFSVAGELWILQINLVKSGYGVRIDGSDSSQRVVEIEGDCYELGKPRKCEVLSASPFQK